jgi:hypothetical protein|tara:strand:- start:892 stop:1323 length:432 start_codon:yes stop_codon:yes gene_type:complete
VVRRRDEPTQKENHAFLKGRGMTEEEKFTKQIEAFKTFCRNNRLRLKESGDGLPVARAIGKFKEDEFYCNFKDGSIGVYAGRDTPRQFTYLHKKLMKLGCIPHQIGDFEGSYDLEWMNIPPVARLLKIKKGAAKVKDPKWLRE